ncbi:TonB-dependent receptor domain-containing protein [Larkinella insperata]|uniref:TonB-dependent receptor domain-containing protein n=1 Tax=Larkinella insperata TaxID=332158 RepID=A0ABW3Q623_9BACT|nr:TonB-dependent receptor [Larkinella insperata]
MKYFFLLAGFWLLATGLFAQSPTQPGRFSIQGRVVDTTKAPLPGSSVLLLEPSDSSLVNFTRSGENGAFQFKNIKRKAYLLKITYVGTLPYGQTITPPENNLLDLGAIPLKPISKELFEVVIRTAKAPLSIRGDTIEYNATTFKVPPGSTVEDLLRRLPGVQVDANGNIKAQGQDVKRLTVDGKTFFGSDPKMATKNLQAEAISKVQVFNDQSEKSKLTGVDDGSKQKTMNLELKDEFKKGGFGKVTASGGSAVPAPGAAKGARGEVKANYNKFDAKRQLSLIGLVNNTNQQGMSWDDYQDFRGSNAFNWNDDADFGFSGGFRYWSGEDEDNLGIPIGGDRGRGFSNNAAIGANYNYDTKKNKFSSSYYYSQTRQQLEAKRWQQNFFDGGFLQNDEQSNQINFTGAHRVTLRYERQIDSLQTLVFVNNSRLGVGNSSLSSLTNVLENGINPTSRIIVNNGNRVNSFGTANTLLYRHKFKKKGRSFAASATYQLNTSDGSADLTSDNQFFQSTTVNAFLRQIRQRQLSLTQRSQYKANLQYIEPISKRIFWENFYNFSLRYDELDRDSYNQQESAMTRNDTLSRYYKNNYLYNRLGTGLRYSYKGLNLSVGGAYQQFALDGRYASDESVVPLNRIQRTFSTFVPNVSLNYDLKNNRFLFSSYSMGVQVPSSRDLQPVIDISNPLYISEGNPDLLPALSHNVNVGYNMFNPGSFVNIYGNVYYSYNINQIVYGRNIDPTTGITRTRPENITGGQNAGAYIGGGFPLKKTKATLNMSLSGNLGRSLTPINNVLYQTHNRSISFGPRLELTPGDKLTFYANADWNIGHTRYDLMASQNQRIINNTYGATVTGKLSHEFYLTSNLNYSIYRNPTFGFDQRIPIWNASVYKIMGKSKKAEVRLSAYDMLNRNLGISQNASLNFVSGERVQTLARYFLLSFTYNMRGVSTGNIKQRWF